MVFVFGFWFFYRYADRFGRVVASMSTPAAIYRTEELIEGQPVIELRNVTALHQAPRAQRTGSLTVRLAQNGMAVTGVDLSAAMLRQAEKRRAITAWKSRLFGKI